MSPLPFEHDRPQVPPNEAPGQQQVPTQRQAIDSPQMSEQPESPEERPLTEQHQAYMRGLEAEQARLAMEDQQQRETEQRQVIQQLDLHRMVPFPTHAYISTNLCVIRPYHIQDIPLLERHGSNWNIARWMTNRFPHPYTRADAEAWVSCQPCVPRPFEEITPATPSFQPDGNLLVPWDNTINFVIADPRTLELMGGIGVKPGSDVFNRSAELGYWLAEPYWGKGIMTSAVRAYIQKLFFRTMALRKLYAYVFMRFVTEGVHEGNMGSRKVLQNAGFRVEGYLRQSVFKRGEWWDQEIWGILREEVLGDERTMPNGVHRNPAATAMR